MKARGTTKSLATRYWRVAAVVVTLGMVGAACGGGSKKSTAGGATTTTVNSEATTSTTAVTGDTTATTTAGATATTAVGSTATTAKKTTTTTARKSTVTVAPSKAVTNVAGGISNVGAAPTTAPPADFQPGGTLTYTTAADNASLDPTKITNSGSGDGYIAYAIYDMLIYTDSKTGALVPQTAESLTSPDATVWTLKLRPNIKFSDGTPYDAAAVKFNYQRLQDPANAANRAAQANLIAAMDVVDPLTLKLTLKSKNAVFPVAMTLIPFVASPTALQAQGSKYGSDANTVGAGPFLLKSWVRDSQKTLVRNPNYWRQPQPYVEQLVLKPIVDETQRINTFMSGQANLTFVGAGSNADQIQKSGTGVTQALVQNGGMNWYFNTTTKPFNDPNARLAVAMAIDPVDYAKVVNGNLQEPIDSIFRHDSPFYDPTLTQPKYDPVKAQQLINQVAANNGGTFSFTVTGFPVTNYQNSVQYIQGILNGTYKNIHMDIVTEAAPLHITACTAGSFAQVCQFGNNFDDPEPTWTSLYTCNAVPSPTKWCNAQFDKDVVDNQQTLNAQQRISDIKDAQKQFYAELPSWYQERRYSWMFSAPNIQNFRYADDGMPLTGEMWIKTK